MLGDTSLVALHYGRDPRSTSCLGAHPRCAPAQPPPKELSMLLHFNDHAKSVDVHFNDYKS
jgi:hypothetical protein